ncbi:MAG: hypothetical protein II874_03010 [Bacteroidales bacterium]|nr:hypothetical protein [Bacteroidales bacterium]
MKRLILTFATLLAGVLAFAQSLEGTWTGKENLEDNSDGADVSATATVSYTIKGESYSTKMLVVMDMSAEAEGGEVTMKITITGSNAGTWARQGNILTFTPDKRSKPKIDVKVEGIPSVLASMLIAPAKRELSKGLKETERYKIISLTDKELVLEDILTEKEIKAGEKADRITFLKK